MRITEVRLEDAKIYESVRLEREPAVAAMVAEIEDNILVENERNTEESVRFCAEVVNEDVRCVHLCPGLQDETRWREHAAQELEIDQVQVCVCVFLCLSVCVALCLSLCLSVSLSLCL